MAPRISVLLPVYNAAATVRRAVASLSAQSFADFEIVAVDDGSTDGSLGRLRALAEEEPRLRVLALPANGGIVAALSAGVAEAGAPLIARMDADDVAHPRRFEAQLALLEADPGLALVATRARHAPAGEPAASEGLARYVEWQNALLSPEAIALARFVESPVIHPTILARREAFERWGGYAAGPFPEDYDLWLRWLGAGARFAKVPEALLDWHDSGTRLTRTHPAYAPEAFDALKARHLAPLLRAVQEAGRPLLAWGTGKTSRRKIRALAQEGVRFDGYLDIDPALAGRLAYGVPIRHPDGLTGPREGFVVALVSVRGAGELIRGWLTAKGFTEGEDFLLAA